MTAIEFETPVKIESLNRTRDRHWAHRKRLASKHHEAVRYAALAAGWMARAAAGTLPRLPVMVTITRIAPRQLDSDNMIAGTKHVRDEIARLLGVDDNDGRVCWSYVQRRGAPKEYTAHVRVEALSNQVKHCGGLKGR